MASLSYLIYQSKLKEETKTAVEPAEAREDDPIQVEHVEPNLPVEPPVSEEHGDVEFEEEETKSSSEEPQARTELPEVPRNFSFSSSRTQELYSSFRRKSILMNPGIASNISRQSSVMSEWQQEQQMRMSGVFTSLRPPKLRDLIQESGLLERLENDEDLRSILSEEVDTYSWLGTQTTSQQSAAQSAVDGALRDALEEVLTMDEQSPIPCTCRHKFGGHCLYHPSTTDSKSTTSEITMSIVSFYSRTTSSGDWSEIPVQNVPQFEPQYLTPGLMHQASSKTGSSLPSSRVSKASSTSSSDVEFLPAPALDPEFLTPESKKASSSLSDSKDASQKTNSSPREIEINFGSPVAQSQYLGHGDLARRSPTDVPSRSNPTSPQTQMAGPPTTKAGRSTQYKPPSSPEEDEDIHNSDHVPSSIRRFGSIESDQTMLSEITLPYHLASHYNLSIDPRAPQFQMALEQQMQEQRRSQQQATGLKIDPRAPQYRIALAQQERYTGDRTVRTTNHSLGSSCFTPPSTLSEGKSPAPPKRKSTKTPSDSSEKTPDFEFPIHDEEHEKSRHSQELRKGGAPKQSLSMGPAPPAAPIHAESPAPPVRKQTPSFVSEFGSIVEEDEDMERSYQLSGNASFDQSTGDDSSTPSATHGKAADPPQRKSTPSDPHVKTPDFDFPFHRETRFTADPQLQGPFVSPGSVLRRSTFSMPSTPQSDSNPLLYPSNLFSTSSAPKEAISGPFVEFTDDAGLEYHVRPTTPLKESNPLLFPHGLGFYPPSPSLVDDNRPTSSSTPKKIPSLFLPLETGSEHSGSVKMDETDASIHDSAEEGDIQVPALALADRQPSMMIRVKLSAMEITYVVDDQVYVHAGYYSGPLNSNGQMHGNGVFWFTTGDLYLGQFRDGKLHGVGALSVDLEGGRKEVMKGYFRNNEFVGESVVENFTGAIQ